MSEDNTAVPTSKVEALKVTSPEDTSKEEATSEPKASKSSTPEPESAVAVDSAAQVANSQASDVRKDAEETGSGSGSSPVASTKGKTADKSDMEMDGIEPKTPSAAAESAQEEQAPRQGTANSDAAGPPTATKAKTKSRKQSLGADSKSGKKLSRKGSKKRIFNLDAKPGDHFLVKLKGFPQWPCIICDEDMLPQSLLKTRPVSTKRADGTYRDDFADGGKQVADRKFPVMYLSTNEFGWVLNSDLIKYDPDTMKDQKSTKRDLQAAYELAAKSHPLSFYKQVLEQYQEQLLEVETAKKAKAATPKTKKAKIPAADDEDVEMGEAPGAEDEEPPVKEKKVKKRKAEENIETPQRTESVKKPKIKLTSSATPKVANGNTSTPKSSKTPAEGKEPKSKSKSKKGKESEKKVDKKVEEVVAPKEPEMTPEDKHARKEKEVLFIRHKLQRGLVTRDQEPKESEMPLMSDYLAKLEVIRDLDVGIIRTTKINKVLKAILKLDKIPKEDDYHFKTRSKDLLDKWNLLLATDGAPSSAGPAETKASNDSSAGGPETKIEAKTEAKPKIATKGEAKSVVETEPTEEEAENKANGVKDDTEAPNAVEEEDIPKKSSKNGNKVKSPVAGKADTEDAKASEAVEATT